MTGPGSAAAREPATRIVALPARTDLAVRAAVGQALTDAVVPRLSYVDAAGGESERVVEPAGLLTAEGRWYLIAWCRTRRAGRGFRLDRIAAAAPTGEQARPHDLADLPHGSAAADAAPPAALAFLPQRRAVQLATAPARVLRCLGETPRPPVPAPMMPPTPIAVGCHSPNDRSGRVPSPTSVSSMCSIGLRWRIPSPVGGRAMRLTASRSATADG